MSAYRDEPVVSRTISEWWPAAMFLLRAADEACTGVGFSNPTKETAFTRIYRARLRDGYRAEFSRRSTSRRSSAVEVFSSLCSAVDPSLAAVQPKSRTPQVGFTLRALSHNLALLPGVGEVRAIWDAGIAYFEDDWAKSFNLLVIPYPYSIPATSFAGVLSKPCVRARHGQTKPCAGRNMFALNQEWLLKSRSDLPLSRLGTFVQELIDEAERDVGRVDGIVFPEGALTQAAAAKLAAKLAKANRNLQLFVSGAIRKGEEGSQVNGAHVAYCANRRTFLEYFQDKHHRWRLDRDQIARYHLGSSLDPDHVWWEDTRITERVVRFAEFRDGATLATLICEDLARIDPVQPTLRSVGPSLVIVLLLDGAQRADRWSARYATVLADDPGCSVLTLTSWGMVERSRDRTTGRQIGLWKQSNGPTRELEMGPSTHALLLTLSVTHEIAFTSDGRSDDGATYKVELSGVRSIAAHGFSAIRT